MELEYRLSLQDYQEANQAHLKLQRWLYFLFWIFIVLGFWVLIISFFLGKTIGIDILGAAAFFSLAINYFNPYFSSTLKKYQFSRSWKWLSNLHHPITIDVNEESLKITGINFENRMQWQLYIQAIETKNLFMLYQTKRIFNIIPKRTFNSNKQIEEFRELLCTKILKFIQV